MSYDPSGLFDALESKLKASGFLPMATISEPKAPPPTRLGAVIFNGAQVTEVHGTTGSGEVHFLLRFYFDALQEPREKTEKDIARATLDIMDDLTGDFDLGDASVRNVKPTALTATPGYQTISGKVFRFTDLAVEVIVNDLVNFSK